MTFIENKTIKELGIDTTRKFRVVNNCIYTDAKVGDILVFSRDDGTIRPFFTDYKTGITRTPNLCDLEYAETGPFIPCSLYYEKLGLKYHNYKLNNTPKETGVNKIMSIITNAFKSKEDKAMEQLGLGSSTELNSQGRDEFVQYLFQTMTAEKKAFLSKMVEANKENK